MCGCWGGCCVFGDWLTAFAFSFLSLSLSHTHSEAKEELRREVVRRLGPKWVGEYPALVDALLAEAADIEDLSAVDDAFLQRHVPSGLTRSRILRALHASSR